MNGVAALLVAARAGEREAFAALIQQFRQIAHATAYRSLVDHHLAEDLVQEAVSLNGRTML